MFNIQEEILELELLYSAIYCNIIMSYKIYLTLTFNLYEVESRSCVTFVYLCEYYNIMYDYNIRLNISY